ncbi:type II toxin-antitoxin system RelE/ParE family toxin [Roseivirga ehrenbergii]|uniref:type II toxin-antitoxin system RelE/ParE family toxin n=1 Tax=Roseivirga ehrenbergii (strain DSM 102268 / JCM 13514 / KCTC 12282 / NCIMB 14502 / KMM 6017) TaxID=279360 RepID=UPI0035D00504
MQVRYSLCARHEQIELLEYIVQKFGRTTAQEVYERIEKVLDSISQKPEIYRASKRQADLRKCVLSKQTSIYYRINEGYIEVVSFRANLKNPKNFKI